MLTVVMALSLVVVASAAAPADGKVNLVIEPKTTAKDQTEVEFNIYLEPGKGVTEIGAFQFSVVGHNCTIQKVTYINNGNNGNDSGGLEFHLKNVGREEAEEYTNGYFQKFGGALTNGTYKFLAAGTSRTPHEFKDEAGKPYSLPAHIWNENLTKTLIVTLKVQVDAGAKSCSLTVLTDSTGRFSVGSSVQKSDGTYEVKETCTGAVSNTGYGVLLGDLNGDNTADSTDLNMLFNVVLEYMSVDSLSASQKEAADINKDGNVDSTDLNMLFNHVLEYINIHE